MLYAVSNNSRSWRAIQTGWPLLPGETLSETIPQLTAEQIIVDKWQAIYAKISQSLDETSWVLLTDAPLTGQEKTAMNNYRSALINLCDGYSDPDAVVFPTRPNTASNKFHKKPPEVGGQGAVVK